MMTMTLWREKVQLVKTRQMNALSILLLQDSEGEWQTKTTEVIGEDGKRLKIQHVMVPTMKVKGIDVIHYKGILGAGVTVHL